MDFARYRPHLIATLALGLPLIGSHLARMAIGLTDTLMISWYGVEALGALVIATSLFFIIQMLGSGFGIGVMGLLASAHARGDDTEMRRATRMALWLSSIHAMIAMPFLWFSKPILLALGQTDMIASLAQDYLRIAGWGILPVLWMMVLNSYLAAMERTQVILWITVAGIPLNILFNWCLIFGNWGFPELGVQGAAIASVSTQTLGMAAILAYALWLPEARRFNLMQRFWKPDWHAFRAIFALGMPVGLTLVAEVGMFVGANLMMGWIGTLELGAHGIALQIASVTFMVQLGLANAATIRVGQMVARDDGAGMRDAAATVLSLSLIFALLSVALFLLAPRTLIGLYLDFSQPEAAAVMALAVGFLVWAALFQLTDALQVVGLGLLRGAQDTRVPMWLAAISYWLIGLPAGYVLAFPLGMGGAGLWLGLVIGLSVASVLMLRRFYRGLARGDWTPPLQTG
ncbi:MAG: MATE family efflux transporter [Paracoccus sp. (in: a-proteobacteria)]|nr:MATE family efflux transporter [Paracoccus sp. (in: a-proteobacteria)]